MKNIRFVTISIMITLFFVISYFTIRSFYFRQKITSYISELTTINNNCAKYICVHKTQKTLDKNLVTRNISPDAIQRISFCKYSISKLKFPKKYSKVKSLLLRVMEDYTTIYIETKNICHGESIENLGASLTNINKAYKSLHTAYNTLNENRLFNLGSTKTLDEFIIACNNYVNSEIERLRTFEIHYAKKELFTNEVTNIYYELRTLISTNNYAKTTLRLIEAKKDITPILLSIQDHKLSLSKLKIKLSSLSIPEGLNSYFYSIQSMLQSYNLYLEDLCRTINTENISYKKTGKRNMKLESQYKELDKALSSLLLSIEDFSINLDKLLYDKFKTV